MYATYSLPCIGYDLHVAEGQMFGNPLGPAHFLGKPLMGVSLVNHRLPSHDDLLKRSVSVSG